MWPRGGVVPAGLAMRRIADLYPRNAETDARNAFIIAEAAGTMPHALRRADTGDEVLTRSVSWSGSTTTSPVK
ncbi:MAG: hypothetical protein EKK51_27965 [Mycolicibacterium sp.]|nr:MAG: hypothetical protein EKK51_27965 [Mycolicibacterium sp.]